MTERAPLPALRCTTQAHPLASGGVTSTLLRVADATAKSDQVDEYQGSTEIRFSRFYLCEAKPFYIVPPVQQASGLVAAVPGRIRFRTGPGVDSITLAVRMSRTEPLPELDRYADIAEISYRSNTGKLSLFTWDDKLVDELPSLPAGSGSYRLRYHVADTDTREGDNRQVHTGPDCLIQLWPAKESATSVIQITSRNGLFWHSQLGSVT